MVLVSKLWSNACVGQAMVASPEPQEPEMGRKAKKSKTERMQELQAKQNEQTEVVNPAVEPTDAQIEQAAATAEVEQQEAQVLTDEERQADAARDAQDEANDDLADGAEPAAEADGEGEEKVPASIVPRKYRNEYKARGHARRCGDELSAKMESLVQDSEGNLVLEKVYGIAKANGIEKTYHHLNPGQQRMNIGNILRRKLSEGDGKLRVPGWVTGGEDIEITIEPYYSNAQKDAA